MEPAVDSFLKTVLRSGLLDQEQLKAGYHAVPRDQRGQPRAVAEHLIKTGKLSRFQATKLLAGTAKGLLLGPFQVLAPVGRGGMGAVYLARDSRDQKLVALKVLPPKKARLKERLLTRFRREMDLCRRVSHPHIARTFEVGEQNGVYFIAMEFIPGQDLSKLVKVDGPLRVPHAARLFVGVAAGLQHAHDQGLVHRDLKPSNIRVTPHDRAKVLDLGLALLEGDETGDREILGGEGYIVGSMDYIAPEQTYDACAVDGRADIYAMGCSLYFALTGRPPFPGGTSMDKILRQRNEKPTPLLKLNPEVPERFAELVQRMMAKDPAKRLAGAETARRELLIWTPAESDDGDQADDSSFRVAVASLQAADAEDNLEVIPAAQPAPPSNALVLVSGALLALGVVVVMAMLVVLLSR